MSYIERVEAAFVELRKGKMIILVDHPSRENEGDFIFAAEKTTPEAINFMIKHGSGIICLPLPASQLARLGVSLMVPSDENTSQRGTPFTVSIEARHHISTGVSAADRTTTILTAIKEEASSEDIVKPGHIFPLQARAGGVLERAGHTEGSLDIVRLAGLKPAAVLCEVMNPDGTMARGPALQQFAKEHHLTILSIDDIIDYRLRFDHLIEEEVSAELPTEYGAFNISVIKEKINHKEHIILTAGNIQSDSPTLVRIHSSCVTGDLFGSLRCDCQQQLTYSLEKISREGGILIYLNQEGRGIGLFNKIKAYALQEQGFDTVEANEQLGMPIDSRGYHMAATILRGKNISKVRLLTNNPAKIQDLKKYGIKEVIQEKTPVFCNEHNKPYLRSKKNKLHHTISKEL